MSCLTKTNRGKVVSGKLSIPRSFPTVKEQKNTILKQKHICNHAVSHETIKTSSPNKDDSIIRLRSPSAPAWENATFHPAEKNLPHSPWIMIFNNCSHHFARFRCWFTFPVVPLYTYTPNCWSSGSRRQVSIRRCPGLLVARRRRRCVGCCTE